MPTLVDREIGATGFGLMSLTSPMHPTPKDQAFAAMTAALESGANFWNGGQFYGTQAYNSCHLLRDYFEKYPEAAHRVVLSMKGGLDLVKRFPDGSEQFVRKSVEDCLEILSPSVKKIDIFQCARVDPNTPIEDTMKTLKQLVEEGKIGAVGLSEVKAETIKRANKIVPIAAVEVEFSMFETNILTNGVAETCASLGIPIIAYSPLGRGILSGKIMAASDIPANSPLQRLDKYSGENLNHNLRLAHEVQKLTTTHQPHTMAQIALSWIRQTSSKKGMPEFIPISGSSKEKNVRENAVEMNLSEDDMNGIDKIVEENKSAGERGFAEQRKYLDG